MRRNSLAAIITTILAVVLFSVPVFAAETCEISVSENVEAIEVTRGGREQVDLNQYFTDSEGHSLTYTVDEAEESLKARVSGSSLLLDPLEIGEFEVKITATCSEGESAHLTLPVNIVESTDEGNPAQYGYDETPADEVSVYFTISCDGVPLMGNDADNTVLAHKKVTVPYFDLALYGLEKYYRYHTANGRGKYIDSEVVERPTAMHLMIYVTERYYMGLPEEQCCQGTSGVLEYNTPTTMRNMYGDKAYEGKLKAYELTGSATSTYMKYLWGHDENLMYYRNHFFPLMSPGWGSTTDYQLLSENNTFDLGMYTDWEFYHGGSFCCFDKEVYETETGKPMDFFTQYTTTASFGSGELKPITGLIVDVYDEEWKQVGTVSSETAGYQVTFSEAGIFHIIGRDSNAGTNKANKAPATADVIVTDSFDGSAFHKITDEKGNLLSFFEELTDIDGAAHYHIQVPDGVKKANIEFRNSLPDTIHLKEYDFENQTINDSSEQLVKNTNTITLDVESWLQGQKAAVLMLEDSAFAFTFSYYTPAPVNFAPQLKTGIQPHNKQSIREQKNLELKLTDIFTDPDGDEMTFEVQIDEADAQRIESNYRFYSGAPGNHTLVFKAHDAKGKSSPTYTIELKVTADQAPEIIKTAEALKECNVRYKEKAVLLLSDVFDDFDNDDLQFEISTDGTTYESFETENERFELSPSGEADIGNTYTYYFRANDGLIESESFCYTVHVVDDQAPVPNQAEFNDSCMINHYWCFDYFHYFSDPEGDSMSYTVSINGSEPVKADWIVDYRGILQRVLIEDENEDTVTFFATDSYGKTGSFTAHITPLPEVLHEVSVEENTEHFYMI